MATKLFLRNTTTSGLVVSGLTILYDMLTTAGAGVDTDQITLTAGGTEILWTQTAGGSSVGWISPRLTAGFTLTSVALSAWFLESNLNDNAGARARIYRWAEGVVTELGGGPFDDGVEWTGSIAEYTWTANVTDTAFNANDRLILRLFATNVGTMTAGTANLQFNAADAATGDSFFSINENVTFVANGAGVQGKFSHLVRLHNAT